jgi:hypothetical protein
LIGGGEAREKELLVNRTGRNRGNITAGEKTNRDLRFRAEKSFPQDGAVFIPDGHNGAGLDVFLFDNVAPVDPQVAAADAIDAAFADHNLAAFHAP